MTTTTNFGLPIYGNSDKPKWTDTNEAFQDLDNKVADKTADNAFTGTNAFNADLLMKGGSTIESDDGVITPTAPSSDKTGTDVIQINDSAGNPLYKVRPIQHSNGKVDLDIAGQPAANSGVLTFNGEELGGRHVYSTSEQVVGKWIDGRPIYEKTIELNRPSASGEIAIPHGIQNVDHLWLNTAASFVTTINSSTFDYGHETWSFPSWNYALVDSQYALGVVWTNRTNVSIFIGSGLLQRLNKIYLTYSYVKTTD